jgi:hypothetical protein
LTESDVPFVDEFLSTYDVESQHSTEIAASASDVYQATRTVDLSTSWIVRSLFRLRGLPTTGLTLDGLRKIRFLPLLEQPPDGFVLGIVGQFWSPSGHLLAFEPGSFAELQQPGYAKAIWSFDVSPISESTCRLRTVTRVACPDPTSRRRFRLYWSLVGPFSGIVRREILRIVKRTCEQG